MTIFACRHSSTTPDIPCLTFYVENKSIGLIGFCQPFAIALPKPYKEDTALKWILSSVI